MGTILLKYCSLLLQVWFVVSSITGIRIPNPQKRKAGVDDDDDDERGDEQASEEQATEEQANDTAKVHPGSALWVAFSIPSCLASNIEAQVIQIVQSSCLSPVQRKVCTWETFFFQYYQIIALTLCILIRTPQIINVSVNLFMNYISFK